MSTKITLEELIAKLPEAVQPWAQTYAPVFVDMTSTEVLSWIELLAKGDIYTAYKAVLAKMPNANLLNEWNTLNAEWQAANEANADRLALQRTAMTALLRVFLSIALAAVGL